MTNLCTKRTYLSGNASDCFSTIHVQLHSSYHVYSITKDHPRKALSLTF